MNIYDELKKRGFVSQVSDENAVRRMLSEKRITFYVGFDSTARSLHAGSLVPIMAMVHLKRAGHRAIAVIGGGTTLVGDPSGRTEMRKLLDEKTVRLYGEAISSQLDRFLKFDGENAISVNNADWLVPLNYIQFLREIGRHFSVNRMLATEAYRLRLEKGLSFIEFNYQLLQAYDYLVLYQKYGCMLQMGGDDQWGNILAGVDLIRRVEGAQAEALTFPLLMTASGEKMGKTAKGAVWLDASLFSPYEFFQYWINCDDRDVGRFLRLFTLLPLEEIERLEKLKDKEINEAKRILAFETTSLVHGKKAASEAQAASAAAFGISGEKDVEALPTTSISLEKIRLGINAIELFTAVGLTSSRGEAKRLIRQGGLYINEERVTSLEREVNERDLKSSGVILRVGKKKVHRIKAEEK